MFNTIEAAQAEIQKLSDNDLADLTVLTILEHAAGSITDQQAEFVSALILEDMLRRVALMFAEEEKSTATIN